MIWLILVVQLQSFNQATLQPISPPPSSYLPPTKPSPSAPVTPNPSSHCLPCPEWKGIHSAMNVNQSEDEREPNAAVLLWSTQAERHLTENFLIAPWSCSINGLALAIICPCFLSFERETIVCHTSKPRLSFPLLWVIYGVWMLLIYHLVSIKIYGSDYGSASPNQTVLIHPLFIVCLANKNQNVLMFSLPAFKSETTCCCQ